MHPSELIGKKAIRTAPAECSYGKDYSFSGPTSILILSVDDHSIRYKHMRFGSIGVLNENWIDNNWDYADDEIVELQKVS